jgi:phosphoribosylaminoimidazole carboxylase
MVNEVAPRPHNSGHYSIEAVPYMSQYKAQIHAVLDLPVPDKLTPRVKSSIMLNILGGATPTSHHELTRMARRTFGDNMDVYLHLYGKESKPGRKIGHITLTSDLSIDELEKKSKPFVERVDEMRQERLDASAEQLRPQEQEAPQPSPSPAMNGGESAVPADTFESFVTAIESRQFKLPKGAAPAVENAIKQVTAQVNGDVNGNLTSDITSDLPEKPLVLVTMGSDSDLPVLKAGLDILREFDVPYTLNITSAHRTPKYMMQVADEAAGKGIKVIIAAAGGAAHLPGMLSSETPLPVIGVPIKATHMDGLDSLLSIVQMPVRPLPLAPPPCSPI